MPTALVTGANRGLGLAFVKQLDKLGWHVYACCRNPSSAGELMALSETSGARVEIKQLDIGQFEQSDRLAGAEWVVAEAIDAAAPLLGAVAGVFVAIGLARSLPLAGLLLAVVVLLLLLGIPRKR